MAEEKKYENGSRELGSLHTSIDFIRADIAEIKGGLTPMSALVAKHESRLDDHNNQLSALWRWKDGSLMRACALVGAAGTIIGGIVYVVSK